MYSQVEGEMIPPSLHLSITGQTPQGISVRCVGIGLAFDILYLIAPRCRVVESAP